MLFRSQSFEELAEEWNSSGTLYKLLLERKGQWWEPPKPFEYEAVWEAGTPCDFIDGIRARTIDSDALGRASAMYQVRYNSYGLGLTEEEKQEWLAQRQS